MKRAIVLAVLITPTHGSFIIKLHILIAAVELSHFTVWIFFFHVWGGWRLSGSSFMFSSALVCLMTCSSSNVGEG